ncbi:MAG: AAA family ATPase [Candidatus Dormibacterales bacterium]
MSDKVAARDFLDRVLGPHLGYVALTAALPREKGKAGMAQKFFRWPGQKVAALAWADTESAIGRDVYFTPALLRRRGRKEEDALSACCLWGEFDEPSPEQLARMRELPGLVLVASSPRHYHLYLRMEEGLPAAEIKDLNLRLRSHLGYDAAYSPHPGSVLRLVGYPNHKHGGAQVELLQHDGQVDPERLRQLLPPLKPDAGKTDTKLEGLAALLDGGPDDPEKGNTWMTKVAGHLAKMAPYQDGYEALVRLANRTLADPIADNDLTKLMSGIWEKEHAKVDAELDKEKTRLRIRRQAEREVKADEAAADFREPEFLPSLADDLVETPEVLPTTIESLHRTGFNALIAAAAKTGKTELGVEVVRSLVDGVPFLGRFKVEFEGRVAFANYELDKPQMIDTFRLHGVQHPERISTLNLRGLQLPIESEAGRAWFINWLKEHEIKALVMDPLSRAFAGDEDKVAEIRPFLDAVDAIKFETGVRDLFLIHHFGHVAERARGTSRLLGWPDALWTYTRQHDDRYLAVEGRNGAFLAESKLEFDPRTHRLQMVGGSRREGKNQEADDRLAFRKGEVRRFVKEHPGLSQTKIEAGVEGRAIDIRRALRELVETGLVRQTGNSYYPVKGVSG